MNWKTYVYNKVFYYLYRKLTLVRYLKLTRLKLMQIEGKILHDKGN